MRADGLVLGDAREQVMELVHRRVLPADHVPVRPPPLPEGMVRLGHQHVAEPLAPALGLRPDQVHLELVHPPEVEGDRSFRTIRFERPPIPSAPSQTSPPYFPTPPAS